MGFVELLKKRAKESVKTIVLPETEDMRTLEATDKILKEELQRSSSSVMRKRSTRKLQRAALIFPVHRS